MPRVRAALPLALGLAGCFAPQPYVPPAMPVPTSWQRPAPAAEALDGPAWWQRFEDPELLRLQAVAEQANPDLQIALRHVLAAEAGVGLARAEQGLQLSLGAGPVDAAALSAVGRKTGLYAIGFSARYALDFWGRLARGVDTATAAREASRDDAGTVQITLRAELARRYFALRELDERLSLQDRRLALLEQGRALQAARFAGGRSSNEPLQAALAALDAAGASRAQLVRERRQIELELAVLVGKAPEDFALAPSPLRTRLHAPTLPALLPATVVERRPDLLAAEQRLRAAHAEVEAARTEWLPKISLDTELGLVSGPLRGSRGLAGIGPELDWTLLDGGRREAELDARRQAREIAVIDYRKAVLAALKDVESALLMREAARAETDQAARRFEQAQALQAREALRLTAGRSSGLQSVDAGLQVLTAEEEVLRAARGELDAVIALYLALGGGWQPAQLPPPP